MANPFPGIDPFIEDQYYWPDFHHYFIAACGEIIGAMLPEPYDARIEEQISLVEQPEDLDEHLKKSRMRKPDVAIVARPFRPDRDEGGGVAVLEEVDLEPVIVPAAGLMEFHEHFIKIVRREDRSLVTEIEILSPSNKSASDQGQYLVRRNAIFSQPIHLVELDFLVGGRRLPMGGPLPPGDAYVLVSRWDRRPNSEVYAWSIRRRLPKIRIPLHAPDPDVVLDLAAVYATTHERGRYNRAINRTKPLTLPLCVEDRAWAEGLVKPVAG